MLLSAETQLGIITTSKSNDMLLYIFIYFFSFVELVRYLFTIPGITCFLSERLSQDPLEKLFGCQ